MYNNMDAVNYINENYRSFFEFTLNKIHNEEAAKDIISNSILKLFRSQKDDIENLKAFIYTELFHQFCNYKTVNAKYNLTFSAQEFIEMEPEVIDHPVNIVNKKMQLLVPYIKMLKNKDQYNSILEFLEHGNHTSGKGNLNTQKTNYLAAVKNLRKLVKNDVDNFVIM